MSVLQFGLSLLSTPALQPTADDPPTPCINQWIIDTVYCFKNHIPMTRRRMVILVKRGYAPTAWLSHPSEREFSNKPPDHEKTRPLGSKFFKMSPLGHNGSGPKIWDRHKKVWHQLSCDVIMSLEYLSFPLHPNWNCFNYPTGTEDGHV